ncbi:hypothetical protein CEUSTIGMA_g10349.t1 [Chlamydomonas eustigma]|uniref:Calcineurin-like phosphoesterase domain-containing protein n=1 Tax=Chlamydomonas eustigma TaxID=1157962 RepID=A0A250XJ32_9CHLO|nr:hypothetical protein CEUSTIGMA_g10349.t1 [Chlamydomonas eustigma]|eukprot:GAX82922.1 hypothetical protein CEUSTIGMA_g10349.t1 [Chlamydomonas eustigma]
MSRKGNSATVPNLTFKHIDRKLMSRVTLTSPSNSTDPAAAASTSSTANPPLASTLSFIAVGDWGNIGNKASELNVTNTMDRVIRRHNTSFITSLGDNFYSQGVSSTSDPLWTSNWLDVFGVGNNLTWHCVLGNHDWYGNPQAQIDFTTLNPRWMMPDFFWDKTVSFGSKNTTVGMIFIDTNLLNYGYQGTGDPAYPGNQLLPNFIKYGWLSNNNTVEKQLAWIESKLVKHQDRDYLFVMGHHNLFICNNTSGGMLRLAELMEAHNVTAYLFGHRHSLGMETHGPTLYLQSGAGGQEEPACPTSMYSKGMVFGFAHVHLHQPHGVVHLIQSDGQVLYNTTILPRYKQISV